MRNWKQRLFSRKFLVALGGAISGIVLAWTGNGELAQTVSGTIISAGSIIGYILGEAYVDSSNK